MRKFARLFLAVLLLPAMLPLVQAGTTFVGGTQAVTGTFWQATQPVSGTFWQATQPVSGTFWQATQAVSGTFWQTTQPVSLPASSAPTITKVGATTTSAQLIAASATRKGIEVDCDSANTDSVAINFGASAAVYASHKIMAPGSNYAPPPGVVVTSAIQIISNSGTQNCRVIEYP